MAADLESTAPSAHARVGFENVRFPAPATGGGKEKVGLLGATYLVDIDAWPGLSIGPAVYSATTGHRGGFYTVGGEAAWRSRVIGPFGVELGLYAGGGGGAGAPQGGGLMLRPHVDVLWDLGYTAVGLSLSRVKFPNGRIDSTQVGLVLDTSSDFRFVPATRLDTTARADGRSGVGFDRVQFVATEYRTRGVTKLLDGTLQPRSIALIGARADQAWGSHGYWGVEANGAAQREVAGYAEFLGNVGLETEVIRDRLTLGGRVALGTGGGGGISTGGGLLGKVAGYGTLRLTNQFGLSLEAGLTRAPHGDFSARQVSASLVWALDGPASSGIAEKPTRTDFSAGVERYQAPRRNGSTRSLSADWLKIDRFVTPNLFLTGEVHSAVSGNAGGYTAALLGAGWHQPINTRFHVGAEVAAGAAGGGAVDTHGAVIQETAYAGVQLSPAVSLRLHGGHIHSPRGPLSSTVTGLTLTWTYGLVAGN